MAGTVDDYSENSYNVYADIDQLKAMLKKIFKGKAIPGQPTNKAGKPYKEIYYDQVYVKVDSMENVQEIQKAIQDMGYGASSNAEWMQQTKDQMKMIQLVLGGIGAVSLFVAAIGIANTMMMSIYERTKEIGIIKVLGCDMNNIRTMFLLEAGFIGFFGGLVGLILSETISFVIIWWRPGQTEVDIIPVFPIYLYGLFWQHWYLPYWSVWWLVSSRHFVP